MKNAIRLVLVAAYVGAFFITGLTAEGQSAGTVHVRIADAATKKPLTFTVISLYGPRSLRGLSGLDGSVTFDGLPLGTYEIVVAKNGFIENSLHSIVVASDAPIAVSLALQREPRRPPSWLRTIATVASKPKPKTSTTRASDDAPEAKMSNSMVSALTTLPNVVLRGSGFSQYPSIGGHPASQTAISIEGVPVSGFGDVPNLQPFNLDLFNSVNISKNSAYGATGGTINFDAPDPTLDWIGAGNAVGGSFGNGGLSIMERGTLGRLGVVVTHAMRNQGNPLDGMRFLDTSGLNYVHRALATTSGDIIKLRYPFSLNNVLFGSVTSIRSNVPLFCTAFTGPTPCGYGPLNEQTNSLTSAQIRDSLYTGRLSAYFTVFHNRISDEINQDGRYLNGVHLPQDSATDTVANGIILDGEFQVGRGYPLSFNVISDSQSTSTRGNAFGTIVPAALSSLAYTSASITGPLLKAHHFTSNLTVGMQHQRVRSRTNAAVSLSFTPTSYDTYSLQYATGLFSAPAATFSGVADPPSLHFNCDARTAVGLGPSTPSSDSSTTTTTASWNHTGKKLTTSVSLHHEIDANGAVLAFVNGSAFNQRIFIPAYLAGVQQSYIASCGAAAQTLTPENLFFEVNAFAPRITYDGGELSAHLEASRNVSVDFAYGLMLARAYGSGGLIFSNGSTVIAGMQLPSVPLHTANLSVAARIGRAGVTALANVRYVSSNNPNNLPAYTTVDAGLQMPLKMGGRLTASLLNLTNTQGGTFATTHSAVPLPTLSGAFATIATPLVPHSINVSWSIPFGFGAQLEDVPHYDSGPSAYGFKLYPYPNVAPSDPFALDRRSGRCGPEAVKQGTQYLGIVRQYVARIEAIRAKIGIYPALFPGADVHGLHMYYRRNADSFAVLLAVDKNVSWDDHLTILKPLAGCARIYSGFLPDTQRRHLYIPPYDEQQQIQPVFDYAPEVGFYDPPSLIENDALFPAYATMPKTAPADPFAISEATCPSNLHPGAEAMVALLRPYIAAYYHRTSLPLVPDGFTITPHKGRDSVWLEIQSSDINVKLLAQCLRITGAQPDALQKMGLDGTRAPSLDFAPQIGLYDVW